MFESQGVGSDTRLLAEFVTKLAGLEQGVDDSVRIDRIRLLEELKSAAAAAQAREAAAFAASQRAQQLADGVPAERATRGVAAQVGLARRVSPFEATRYVGWSTILTTELPDTFAALQSGQLSEWRALVVARETAWLSRTHRAAVDRELASELSRWGNRRVEAETKKAAYRLDPAGYLARIRGAESDRRVTLRPAPDTMARLGGLLPVAQGVAAYAALGQVADTLIAAGDPRRRGQIMADTLVERVTGQATADSVPVEIELVMTDRTLLGTDTEPGEIVGYGPVPAAVARKLALSGRTQAPRWLRRLYTHPGTHRLMAMESRRRCFTQAQTTFITLRDQRCRTPWCDAPIRHIDHVRSAEHGGSTHVDNGQGYCAACNYAREAPHWSATTPTGRAGDHVVTITPTGHQYVSRPPDLPGTVPKPLAA
jgi:uncharacterized protein DUF222